ncbi:putative Transcriptional regulator, LysR family [Vibrio coralliirubri]|uniref:LysR family transcriptional regulator n=1 Tax=Vibrio coralliirubri TaxID=1516159 RepID=UPI00063989CA|nr:LysR family transcriptional regulator [Vibrio coralliirubri]CDT66291.1 putative Transcriptional regulator, LysR family [Vibrio coralliirubri]
MSIENLARLDLNLLVNLHVLLDQRNVTRAAEQLNLSQSAISKSLARLRVLFDDPLLERSGYGMEPTLKAKQIQSELKRLMVDIERITAPTTFNPFQSSRKFHIAVVESSYSLIFPKFITEVLLNAPNITIDSCRWGADTFERLQRGELDFAITGKDMKPEDEARTLIPPKGVVSQELYQDELCCLVSNKHPCLEGIWDLEQYLTYRHIMVKNYSNERWLVDLKLAEKQFERNIALYVPDFNSAAELCGHTELILTVPKRFAEHTAKKMGLKVLPLPIYVPPLTYPLFWHENRSRDLAHAWLKQLIVDRYDINAISAD